MAKASLLPSGAYRTQATKIIDGKLVKKSFTVHPRECKWNEEEAKEMSEKLAAEWQASIEESKRIMPLYLKELVSLASKSQPDDVKQAIGFLKHLNEKRNI